MILTCPECATSYFVDDSRIPAGGRRVKCSSCGRRWMAGPEGPILEADSFEPSPQPTMVEPEPVAPQDEAVAAPAEVDPPLFRRPVVRPSPPARASGRTSVLVWAGAAAVAAALIAGALIFREQVVRIWPKTSEAYAGLGLEVAGGGLVLEQVEVKPDFLAGRPVLSVTGAIRNLRDVAVEAPPVRLTLLDRAGQTVAAKIARPDDATIPARAQRRFAVDMLDPPSTARDLEVRFESAGSGKTTPVPAATPAPLAAPAAMAPIEATPAPPPLPAPPSASPPTPTSTLSPAAASEHG